MHDSEDESRPAKRQRNWIARQACEACRARKTRCDEEMPCSLCRNLGVECVYTDRKATKSELSINAVLDALKVLQRKIGKLESKIDSLSTQVHPRSASFLELERVDARRVPPGSPYHMESIPSVASISSPRSQGIRPIVGTPNSGQMISFSAHQTVHWPGVRNLLLPELRTTIQNLESTYPTQLELSRQSFDVSSVTTQSGVKEPDWLGSLSLTCIKVLSNAYFNTFNRVYPLVDRDYYYVTTLAQVVREGFNHDVESCLVLNIMALGCMGLKAHQQAGFDADDLLRLPPLVKSVLEEDICGLSFFGEALKRVGACVCHRDIQSCQFYMTSAVFFSQIMRPADAWLMINRAAATFTTLIKCPMTPDEWLADIRSRIFWSTLLLETVIVQELDLHPSRLREWEEVMPLPKFVAYAHTKGSRPKADADDDTFYHYHFLAQIAHRIILSRIRDELFYNHPSTALADELRHQLEEWRANLPHSLTISEDCHLPGRFKNPADVVVITLLEARYRICIYHLGRPFLQKALQNPSAITDTELRICADTLSFAMDWPLILDICVKMTDFMPLKFFACSQMFGQLFIFYAFKCCPDARIREVIPPGTDEWCRKMMRYITPLVDSTPTVAKDLELLRALYGCELDT